MKRIKKGNCVSGPKTRHAVVRVKGWVVGAEGFEPPTLCL